MLITPAFSPVEAHEIRGGAHAGKTATLLARARMLQESGERNVLFVVAAPQNIARALEALHEGATVLDARALALHCLGAAGAARTRLLDPYEEQFLMEDLRTCGLPQKQLRKVLAFIYATMATCGDWNDNWIEMHEERLVYNTLMDALTFTGGTVEAEVANRAAHLLCENATARTNLSFDHVFVDDYGLLNRSSQLLCNLLARKSITVAGEPDFTCAIYDSHPYPAGLDEFEKLHANVDVETLVDKSAPAQACAGAENAVASPHEEHLVTDTIKDEFEAIIAHVKNALEEGVSAKRIALMGTNRAWLKNLAHACTQANIPIQLQRTPLRIHDFRDEKGCASAYSDTLDKLARNPHDGVALRSWYGFGDYLARSAEVKQLREQHPGAHIADLTELVPPPSNELLAQARAAQAGMPTEETETVVGTPAVWVGNPRQAFGSAFDLVICGGLVAGWLPARGFATAVGATRERLMHNAQLALDCARRATDQRIIFTSFSTCELAFAEHYGIDYQRSRLRNGVRTCEVPTTFEALGDLSAPDKCGV